MIYKLNDILGAMGRYIGMLRNVATIVGLVMMPIVTTVSCHDSNNGKNATGIGTVERNDSVLAIHFYKNTFVISDADLYPMLHDSDRVSFSGSGVLIDELDENQVYDFNLTRVSEDLRQPLFVVDSVARDSAELMAIVNSADGFYSQNIHITRDWHHDDYFDATAVYYGADNGEGDYFGLIYDSAAVDTDAVQIFWLRLYRHNTDTMQVINKDISVPVNQLRDSTKERILMRIKRIDAYGDTVSTDYVYSYINWIDGIGPEDGSTEDSGTASGETGGVTGGNTSSNDEVDGDE